MHDVKKYHVDSRHEKEHPQVAISVHTELEGGIIRPPLNPIDRIVYQHAKD